MIHKKNNHATFKYGQCGVSWHTLKMLEWFFSMLRMFASAQKNLVTNKLAYSLSQAQLVIMISS